MPLSPHCIQQKIQKGYRKVTKNCPRFPLFVRFVKTILTTILTSILTSSHPSHRSHVCTPMFTVSFGRRTCLTLAWEPRTINICKYTEPHMHTHSVDEILNYIMPMETEIVALGSQRPRNGRAGRDGKRVWDNGRQSTDWTPLRTDQPAPD